MQNILKQLFTPLEESAVLAKDGRLTTLAIMLMNRRIVLPHNMYLAGEYRRPYAGEYYLQFQLDDNGVVREYKLQLADNDCRVIS